MSRFEHDCFVITENTKSFFWTKIDIESINIKSNIENFAKMTHIFEQLTSKDILDNINSSIEKRVDLLENILEKEITLSSRVSDNIINSEKLATMVDTLNTNIQAKIENFSQEKEIHNEYTKLLNNNVKELNEALKNISSTNLELIYTNIVKSIETMKNETDRIGWRFHKELDEYDSKFSNKLQNSLESIDEETAKIIEDLKEFKEMQK